MIMLNTYFSLSLTLSLFKVLWCSDYTINLSFTVMCYLSTCSYYIPCIYRNNIIYSYLILPYLTLSCLILSGDVDLRYVEFRNVGQKGHRDPDDPRYALAFVNAGKNVSISFKLLFFFAIAI